MTKSTKRQRQKTREQTVLVKKEYADQEKLRITKYLERTKREPVKFKSGKDDSGKPALVMKTPDVTSGMAKLTEAFGTPDTELQTFLLNQVVQTFKGLVSSDGFNDSRMAEFSNNAMALLNGIQPKDEVEGMLAIQMIAVHNMVMETMRLAMITGQPPRWVESNVNYATKMLGTFTAQMEALKRYRTGGQQKVIVEHVHVNEGGQAIVGVVNRGRVTVESGNEPRTIRRGWQKNNNPPGDPNSAPRCGAKTRKGTPCRAPAMANGRCRMHGGKSTGPRTPEGLERSRKANWKHGYYSVESIALRRYINWLLRESRDLIEKI